MFEDALRYPWTGEKRAETLLVGGVLTLLGFLIVPVLFVLGYVVRVIRHTAAGDVAEPPSFSEWAELLFDGVAAVLVSLVYVGLPAALVAVSTLVFVVPVSTGSSGSVPGSGGVAAVVGALFTLGVAVVFLLVLVLSVYLAPAAVAAYARTERFDAAFSPAVLRPVVTGRRYATGWLVAVGIAVLAQLLGGAVSATVLGAILVPFLTFYAAVAGAYALGTAVRGMPPVDSGVGTPTRQPAT